MTAERIETQIQVVDVRDDASWKYSLDLDIPAFGDRTFKYVTWRKTQGEPPMAGDTILGVLEPFRRSSYYIKRGDITEGEVDGSEEKWQLDWNLVEVSETPVAPPPQPKAIGQPQSGSLRGAEGAGSPPPTVFVDGNLRFRVEQEGWNDRKAVTDAIAMVEPGTWTVDGLLEDAAVISTWYNTRLMYRLRGGLVGEAQKAGAVVADVADAELPKVKNRAEVNDYAKERGWGRDAILQALEDGGWTDGAAYLDEHSPQELLAYLVENVKGEVSW